MTIGTTVQAIRAILPALEFIAEAAVNAIRHMFLAHPQAVNESYAEHAGVAFSYAGRLLLAGCAALVHAFIPALFEKTASSMIRQMRREMDARTSGSWPLSRNGR